jgi:hypothetical protein
MAFVTDTIQEVFDKGLAFLESRLNQESPAADKSYNRTLAAFMALLFGSLLKFGSDKAKEALTISASIIGLTVIGQGRNITRKPAESTVLTFTVPATTGTVIETTVIYKGDNGVRYQPDAQVTAVAGVATITATALTPGAVGNLNIGDTVKADRTVPGATQTGTITVIVTTGADIEEVEDYRRRLLADERTEGGGSNSADYRRWTEETTGVERGYPYSGNPTYLQGGGGSINPGERTIFVKAQSSIDVDGVAPQSLLDDVEDNIRTDPDTGLAREVLGCDGDATRFVESIFNTTFFVLIIDLDVSTDIEAQVKADIETALKAYFRSVEPFISGLDFINDKNDEITVPSVSKVVQDVVAAAGGSFGSLLFNIGAGSLPSYSPEPGELTKLADVGGVTYA